jgi:hypothetical protein
VNASVINRAGTRSPPERHIYITHAWRVPQSILEFWEW